jgi:hypothetical protein
VNESPQVVRVFPTSLAFSNNLSRARSAMTGITRLVCDDRPMATSALEDPTEPSPWADGGAIDRHPRRGLSTFLT